MLISVITGCGGGDNSEGDTQVSSSYDGVLITSHQPSSDTSIFTTFFVNSFSSYAATAESLIENDQRYRRQNNAWFFPGRGTVYSTYPLQSSGIHYAHAAGLTGAGQLIAIIDNGFQTSHEVFEGKTVSTSNGFTADDHGTEVASVAAGNSSEMIGVAPEADLLLDTYNASFSSLANSTAMAESMGAVVQNNSWGYVDFRGNTLSISQENYNDLFSSSGGQTYINALKSYIDSGGVVVFAASNTSSDTQADLMSALPVIETDLEKGWIAAVNIDADMNGDDVVSAQLISSGCMEAAAWCLSAEGTWDAATYDSASANPDEEYALVTGTSFAAPTISGALALLAEAFPTLSGHDLRLRLFASADDEFAGFESIGQIELVEGYVSDVSAEYGHGVLDVAAALLPIGETEATMGDGSVYNISEPLAIEGSATGDAITRALTGTDLVVNDALGTQFSLDAGMFVATEDSGSLTDSLYASWDGEADSSCCGLSSYYPNTQIVGTGSDDFYLKLYVPPSQSDDESYGVTMERDFQSSIGDITLSVNFGRDGGDLLPSWYSGSGTTFFASEVELTRPITSGTNLELSATIGTTFGDIGGLDGNADFTSTKAAFVHDTVWRDGDRLSVYVGLPVAVQSGNTTMAFPIQTRSDGTTEYQDINVDLAPQDREIRIGFEYTYPVWNDAELTLSAAHAENYGNISQQDRTAVLFGIKARF